MFKKFAGAIAALGLSVGAAQAVPAFSFIIDGNTYTTGFSFTNTSDAGESILSFGIDLTTGAGSLCFDTVDTGPCRDVYNGAGTPFAALDGTDVDTGFESVTVVDGGTDLLIEFSAFDVSDIFSFEIDVDDADAATGTIYGSDMIGVTAFADFSDGQRVTGIFAAVAGNSDAAAFSVTGVTSSPSAVPLPAGLPLVLTALAAFGLTARRKRK